jgi:hypothetical protein
MNEYISKIENSVIKIEVNYECSIHDKIGVAIVKKFKSKPKTFNGADWQTWQYPKQDELCPICRSEKATIRLQQETEKSKEEWFNNRTEEQKRELIEHQKNAQAEKEYEERLRCQNGYTTKTDVMDYKKRLAGDI